MMDVDKLFDDIAHLKVAIIGDVMLDTYWWGHVDRISPEAPVPVVVLSKKEYRLGGASNVALNTVALKAQTTLFAVIGADEDGATLMNLLQDNNINTNYIIKSNERITTNKSRIISRNQQMMRLDAEITSDISTTDEAQLIKNFSAYVEKEKPAVLIFEDYNKGVLTESLIAAITNICKANNIVTAVDPKRKNFFAYKNVDIFKPNLKEVKEGLNLLVDKLNDAVLNNIHQQLHKHLQHHISLITLSELGVFIQKDDAYKIVPAHIRNIADVSGAGDTVIAVASLVYAATKDPVLTAELANLAGGLVCEEVGTAAINPAILIEECKQLIKA
jgi:rfaE bifunctional protein kinase chain/domain